MKKILLENAGNQVEITEAQLSEEKAKVLITYGYLKPIMNGFDENTQATIENLIEGRM